LSDLAARLAPVEARLDRLRGAIRALYFFDGVSRLALTAGAFVVSTFLIDWLLHLPREVRLLFLAAGAAWAAWTAARRVLYPLRVPVSDDDLALFVERHYPELNGLLISALQLSRGRGAAESAELVDAVVSQAEQATSGLDFGRILVRRHVGRLGAVAALAVAVLLALGAAFPAYASIYFHRIAGGSAKWPQRTHLLVLDFPENRRVVARGDDLTVAVQVDGWEPSKVLLSWKFATGEKGVERMSPHAGRRYQFTFTHVNGPFTFSVEGGDDQSADLAVDVVTPPSVDAVRVWLKHPPYLKLADTPEDRPEASGAVTAPVGTQVRFEAVSNEPLRGATMAFGLKGKEQTSLLVLGKDGRTISGGFTVAEPVGEYSITLQGANGLSNRDPIRYAIKGLEDRAPEIVVKDPLGDEFVTDVCDRPLEIDVRDDYGISRIALEYRVLAQEPAKSKDWIAVLFSREQNARDYGETQIRSETKLDLGPMGLAPGDHVELRFRAEDYKDVGVRNVRLSKVYKLSVVSLGALEKELQDAIERVKTLIKAQKARQDTGWTRTGRLLQTYGRAEFLTPDQQGEVRQAGLEQNDLTSKIDGARRDVRQIMRRGVYNKIFNETAAAKLQGALDELEAVVGAPDDPTRPGMSRLAASKLDAASRLKKAEDRSASLREGQGHQGDVSRALAKALEHLDKWSSYQEVIRVAREIKEAQERVNKDIKKSGGGR
jgi:hypothetical protein